MNRKCLFGFSWSVLAALAIVAVMGCSSSADAGDDVVKIRFSIDPAALANVTSSAQLMDVLHENLSLTASTPLKSELVLHVGFRAFQSRSDGMEIVGYDQTSPNSITGSGIFVDVERGKPLNGRIRDLRFYTLGGLSEAEAWQFFREKAESGLAYSMWSSGAFQPGEENIIPLKVDEVADGSTVFEPDGTRMVLEITAETLYRDGSKFGSKTPPEGYTQSLETVQLVLSPLAAAAATSSAIAPVETAEPAADEPSGLVRGVYGNEDGRIIVDEIEGQLVFYNGNMDEPTYWPLSLVEDNEYSALYNDTPVEIRFSVDDAGRAFAMTIVQGGNELKLPREN